MIGTTTNGDVHREALGRLHELRTAVARLRDAQVACARILARMDAACDVGALLFSSVGQLGEQVGLGAVEARTLLDFGLAMSAEPHVEEHVRSGRIPVASAACVGQVHAAPGLLRPEDDWVGWAQAESTRALRRRVEQRKEEVRLEVQIAYPVTVFVRREARDDFDRARAVASRKAARALTRGETFEVVVDHYLETYDPERVAPGTRRSPPTSMVNGRYVPAAVRREVYDRQKGSCAVPFCEHSIFVEMAHLVPHAGGGDREADNLLLLCSFHHFLFDEGALTLRGTAVEPQFLDAAGRDLAQRYGAAPATSDPASRSGPASSGAGPPAVRGAGPERRTG